MNHRIRLMAPALVTAVLFGVMAVDVLSRPTAADSEPFHREVAELAKWIPLEFDGWVGKDRPSTAAAIQLLKPNVILQRSYIHEERRLGVGFLVVQTRDARDMIGHYPPVCYPAHGWQAAGATPVSLQVGDMKLKGVDYRFTRREFGKTALLSVIDIILLPDGRSLGEMNAVGDLASDYRHRHYGAAQIQVVFHNDLPLDKRVGIAREMLEPNQRLIRRLLNAVPDPEGEEMTRG